MSKKKTAEITIEDAIDFLNESIEILKNIVEYNQKNNPHNKCASVQKEIAVDKLAMLALEEMRDRD